VRNAQREAPRHLWKKGAPALYYIKQEELASFHNIIEQLKPSVPSYNIFLIAPSRHAVLSALG